ncbi:hypothetical protein [Roseomonas gilardii]|uniref:hypothetical protein n=1 Tax=Roseomonas gilardii TaxID=257708 RepID=UPI000488579B|nr:hypothetical protein [Roseomonas gilardii]
MRQRPGTANLVVYADIATRDRAAPVGARLLLVEGRVECEAERAEVPVIHLDATACLLYLLEQGVDAALPSWTGR